MILEITKYLCGADSISALKSPDYLQKSLVLVMLLDKYYKPSEVKRALDFLYSVPTSEAALPASIG